MVEEASIDMGGISISRDDILTDDLICKIKNLNPILGTPQDPEYANYAKYREEFENAELIVIDAQALNRNSITSLDLSGAIAMIENMASNYYQMDENFEVQYGDEFSIVNPMEMPKEYIDAMPECADYMGFGNTFASPFEYV